MIVLIFLPFLITTTSAVCLPDSPEGLPSFNQNEDYHQSQYYGNPAAFQNEAAYQRQFPQRPEFFEAFHNKNPGIGMPPERLREPMQDFNLFPGYMTTKPEIKWRYNQEKIRTKEYNKQKKAAIKAMYKGPQQFNGYRQECSINCKPYAGLNANNFYGDDYSNLYNLAAPYIYNQKYLDYLKSLTGYNFPTNMDFTGTQMSNLDLEKMRIRFGNKWDQLQDFYSHRYLMFLESLYGPNSLKNVNVDQYYAMLPNFNKDKTMPFFIRPEYNLNDFNQHAFSYLEYLQNLYPGLFNQFQPYQYSNWGTYPWTTGHQQIPINNNQLPPQDFGDRVQTDSKNEVKVSNTVKDVKTEVGDENGERVLGKEEGFKITDDDKSKYETNKNNEYAGEKFDEIQVGAGDVSPSVEGEQFSEAGRMGMGGKFSSTSGKVVNKFGEGAMNGGLNRKGSTENQSSYANGGLVETIQKEVTRPREISFTVQIPPETIERKGEIIPIITKTVSETTVEGDSRDISRMQGSGLGYGGLNQGIEDASRYEIRGSEQGAGGDLGSSTITTAFHHGGSRHGHFGSKQGRKFGSMRSSGGDQAIHGDGRYNWHKGRTSESHRITGGKSGDNSEDDDDGENKNVSYKTTVVVKDGSPNGGGMKQGGSSEFFSARGGYNQGEGENGGHTFNSGGEGFNKMYTTGGGGRLERVYTSGGDLNLGGRGFRGMHKSGNGNVGQMFTTGGDMHLKEGGRGGGGGEFFMTTGGGSKPEGDFSTGGVFRMIGGRVGGRREESPPPFGSGSKRQGVFVGGSGDSGLTFSTGGGFEKGGFSSGGLGKSFVGEGKAILGKTTNEQSGASTNPSFFVRFNDETEESTTTAAKDKVDATAGKIVVNVAEKVSEPVDKHSDAVTEKIKSEEAAKV